MLPGVFYRQNRYTTSVFYIFHNYILIHGEYKLRSSIESVSAQSKTDRISPQAPKIKTYQLHKYVWNNHMYPILCTRTVKYKNIWTQLKIDNTTIGKFMENVLTKTKCKKNHQFSSKILINCKLQISIDIFF